MAKLYELKNKEQRCYGDLNHRSTIKSYERITQLTGNDDNALEFNKRVGLVLSAPQCCCKTCI